MAQSTLCDLYRIWIPLILFTCILPDNVWAADTKGTTTTKEYTQPTDVPDNLDERFESVAAIEPSFGGLFFDENGDLNVVLTDTTKKKEAAAAIDQVFGDEIKIHNPRHGLHFQGKPTLAIDDFRVVKGNYGAQKLIEWKRAAVVAFEEDGTVYVDMDETKNRLVVGVQNSKVIPNAEKLLSTKNIPLKVVEFAITKPRVPISRRLDTEHRPTKGGIEIQLSIYLDELDYNWLRQTCTLGFNASVGGVRGFFTNSHCSDIFGETDASRFAQPAIGYLIGFEYLDPPLWTGTYYQTRTRGGLTFRRALDTCLSGKRCRYSDASFSQYYEPTEFSSGVDSSLTIARTTEPSTGTLSIDPISPEIPVIGTISTPIVGMILNKVGRTTGWTYGINNNSCATTRHEGTTGSETNDIILFCQHSVYRLPIHTTEMSAHGDSGSPVFSYIAAYVDGKIYEGAYLAGIAWAGDVNGEYKEFVYSPLSGVERDFGEIQVTKISTSRR